MSDEQNGNGRERPEKKQLAFCREYVKDFNGTQAAKRAGYGNNDDSLAVIACRLLRIVKIKDEIAELLRLKCMSTDEALMRLAEQARGAHSRYIKPDGTVDFAKLVQGDCAHLVKKLKYKGGELVDIEFYDSQVALEKILRAGGAYKDKGDTVPVSVTFDVHYVNPPPNEN